LEGVLLVVLLGFILDLRLIEGLLPGLPLGRPLPAAGALPEVVLPVGALPLVDLVDEVVPGPAMPGCELVLLLD